MQILFFKLSLPLGGQVGGCNRSYPWKWRPQLEELCPNMFCNKKTKKITTQHSEGIPWRDDEKLDMYNSIAEVQNIVISCVLIVIYQNPCYSKCLNYHLSNKFVISIVLIISYRNCCYFMCFNQHLWKL